MATDPFSALTQGFLQGYGMSKDAQAKREDKEFKLQQFQLQKEQTQAAIKAQESQLAMNEFNKTIKLGDQISTRMADKSLPIPVRQKLYDQYRGLLSPYMTGEAALPEVNIQALDDEERKIFNSTLDDLSKINTLVATDQMTAVEGRKMFLEVKKTTTRILDENRMKTLSGALEQSDKLISGREKISEKVAEGQALKAAGLGEKTSPATDIDDFVADAQDQYKIDNNGAEMPPGKKNEARLQFKRAQAEEVTNVSTAKAMVDMGTAQNIAYNSSLGTELAKIATAADLIEARGEVTPVQKKTNAQKKVGGNLATLGQHYMQLDNLGSIVNIKNGTYDNISASVSASDIGQAFARRVGSEPQSIRDRINSVRPLLLNDIRQASEMGARGLDSEKELEFYLQAATDPQRDIDTNLSALIVLDRAYGDGSFSSRLAQRVGEDKVDLIMNEAKTSQGLEKPPVDGARKAKDGKWYVETSPGRYSEVIQ